MKYCSIETAAGLDAYLECAPWFGPHQTPHEDRSRFTLKRSAKRYEVMPSMRLLGYAGEAVCWTCDAKDMLLIVTEYGIWYEHLPLETAVRSVVPGAGTIEEHRCLVASASDYEYLISYLFVCLTFGRGVLLMNDHCDRWFECDHDGRAWVGSNDAEAVEKAREWLNWE